MTQAISGPALRVDVRGHLAAGYSILGRTDLRYSSGGRREPDGLVGADGVDWRHASGHSTSLPHRAGAERGDAGEAGLLKGRVAAATGGGEAMAGARRRGGRGRAGTSALPAAACTGSSAPIGGATNRAQA